jgi:hypothetical protein
VQKVYPSHIPGRMTRFMHLVNSVWQYGTSSMLGGKMKFYYFHRNLRNELSNMNPI